MAILEKVIQMKQRGITEPEIIDYLKQEGLSPREINDALSQSKIKNVLDYESNNNYQETGGMPQEVQMQQSIMSPQALPALEYEEREISGEESQQYAPQEYYPEYQPQAYPEYQPQQSVDIETINELVEQIFEEKIEKQRKQIESFTKFKEEISSEFLDIKKRLEKMENNFNELQIAIIRKIGDYGENIKNISKEVHATQESFSKILDPLTENIQQLREITGQFETPIKSNISSEKTSQEPRKIMKKPKSDFEAYLR